RPQPVIGGSMNEIARAGEGGRNRRSVQDIPDEDLIAGLDVGPRARRAHQRAHAIAAATERRRDRRSDETARAGDENDTTPILSGFIFHRDQRPERPGGRSIIVALIKYFSPAMQRRAGSGRASNSAPLDRSGSTGHNWRYWPALQGDGAAVAAASPRRRER